jgi:signal peptidase I
VSKTRAKAKSGQRSAERSPSESSGPPSRATKKKAQRFLKDVERMLKKHSAKVGEKDQEKLRQAMDGVRSALDGSPDAKRLSTALKELDSRTEQTLGFAKKSTTREYAESIIIAILIAVVLRAFVVEAFKIPTGSMIPTLAVGDHIFVNKFIYGLRVPFTNKWFVEWGTPSRGDVIVFRFPRDTSKDYIKRVIAVAGDRVRWADRDVFVNGKKLERGAAQSFSYVEEGEGRDFPTATDEDLTQDTTLYEESSFGGEVSYDVIYNRHGYRSGSTVGKNVLDGLTCTRDTPTRVGECIVEEGYLFAMGDNRDNSADGREWGGVPTNYVKGKAMFVWFSHGPRSGVRWDRFGHVVH